MNFIKQLQADKEVLANRVNHLEQAIAELRGLALSDKHQGIDLDGTRKDWIASGDILTWANRTLFGGPL